MPNGPWRTGDDVSLLLLDVAAGRPVASHAPISDAAFELAHRHGLVGLMAASPSNLHQDVRPTMARLQARQQVMMAHLQRILRTFESEGIRATVLKGPSLGTFVYREQAHRQFTDLDVLVHPADLSRAMKVLRRDEAVPSIPAQGPKADKRNIPLRDPSGVSFNLDLHWDLFSYSQLQGYAEGATEWAWTQAKRPTDSSLGPLWHLPDAPVICFLATHALFDHRFRMILFRDLTEVALQQPDWEAIGRFADRWSLRSSTYIALLMAVRLTDAPVPQEFLSTLRPRSASIGLTERLLARTDLVRFDGHRPHPLNLAIVLLHDSPTVRIRLAAHAPVAFPEWMRRVAGDTWGTRNPVTPRHYAKPERPPRVLHVLPVDKARGAQTYAKALRNALDSPAVEHRTATIFSSDSGSLEADLDLGLTPGVGRRLGFSIGAMIRLNAYVRKSEPDVLVAHGGEALKYAAFVGHRSRKVVYYKIGTSDELLRNPLRLHFHKWLTSRADLVAGVSNEMVQEAKSLLGTPANRTAYIPNGRDPALFGDLAAPTQVNPVRFVFVGHLTRTKRPGLFVNVLEAMRERGIDVRGLMVGDGPLLEELSRHMPEGIELLGSRDDVPQLLADADVLLFTSTSEGEGMPGVLIEAGMTGLPVVTTDVPGARTVVEDGNTGLVVPVNDLGMLIDACERLARDPDLRKKMGAAARERCMNLFTLQASVDIWQHHLDALMPGTRT